MKKLKGVFWFLVALGFVSFFVFKIGERAFTNQLLKRNGQIIEAVIINKRNYNGNDKVKPGFIYSYQFEVNGKKYTGNSHNKTVTVGDTIEIEYVKGLPILNRPLYYNE